MSLEAPREASGIVKPTTRQPTSRRQKAQLPSALACAARELKVDTQLIIAAGSFGGLVIAFATFWIKFGGRLSKAEANATEADRTARDAESKVTILSAAFSLYREQIAREYVNRDVAREMEDRLTVAIERLGDRFDRFFEVATRKT